MAANTSPHNRLTNVSIVGAGGRSGSLMVEAIAKTGKHFITAITRPDSNNVIPECVHEIKKVDLNDHTTLVQALQGQHVLIITLAVGAPAGLQLRLIDAAIEAKVPWIMPNEWGIDTSNDGLMKDTNLTDRIPPIRAHIEIAGAGRTRWIGLSCGFWYEFSLAGTEARYGFDFDKKSVTFFDDGQVKINTSTWPQVGRAVAALLSLKVKKESDQDEQPCLEQFANKSVYVSSFLVSQKDMFESVLRVTGDKEEDWKMTWENSVDRYHRGFEVVKGGDRQGYAIILYSRVFFKDGSGNTNDKLNNKLLQLPIESLDEATLEAVEMARRGETNAIH